jgi:hypothetical protein
MVSVWIFDQLYFGVSQGFSEHIVLSDHFKHHMLSHVVCLALVNSTRR